MYEVLRTTGGDLWFATGAGVSRYHDGTFQNFTTQDGLVSNNTFCLAEDKEGNVWFGTDPGGTSRYDPSIQSIPVEITVPGFQDGDGNLWFVGGSIGLGKYDGVHLQTFASEDGLPDNFWESITSIHGNRDGNIWIGSKSDSSVIAKYDGERFQTFTPKDGLASGSFETIYVDSKGILWIGSQYYGIQTYNGEKFVRVADRQALAGSQPGHLDPTDIKEAKDGVMWFAMQNHGIVRYDGETFTRFTTDNGLPSNT